MIEFKNLNKSAPYRVFKEKYNKAFNAGQKNIEAIAISSFNKVNNEVDSRFVNLKFIDGKNFIFFSNYNSPKSDAFRSHSQISAMFYWSTIDVQIRIKAQIKTTSSEYSNKYFKNRSKNKNALAISSRQSSEALSYEQVIKDYENAKKSQDLSQCPDYWGGFSFEPYYFEFWQGEKSRINKREVYRLNKNLWQYLIIQP